jgi:hypothetical protein
MPLVCAGNRGEVSVRCVSYLIYSPVTHCGRHIQYQPVLLANFVEILLNTEYRVVLLKPESDVNPFFSISFSASELRLISRIILNFRPLICIVLQYQILWAKILSSSAPAISKRGCQEDRENVGGPDLPRPRLGEEVSETPRQPFDIYSF